MSDYLRKDASDLRTSSTNSDDEIWIVLSDDWELRGNGRGRVLDNQSIPAKKLMDLYERLGIKSTFNLEVMQQLAFEKHSCSNKSIAEDSKHWRKTVSEMVKRGFDVQLHIHPQWWGAEFIDGWWKLDPRWHIADWSQDDLECMVSESLSYLQKLTPDNRFTAFRGGSWGMGPPSKAIHSILSAYGILIDMSMVNGLNFNGNNIKLDYRCIESPYYPYFSNLFDIRKKAKKVCEGSGLIEIPTQSVTFWAFHSTLLWRGLLTKRVLLKEFYVYFKTYLVENALANIINPLRRRQTRQVEETLIPSFVHLDPFGFKSRKSKPNSPIIDLSSRYSIEVWKVLADICIRRALKTKSKGVKILIFENHTKDLENDEDFFRVESVLKYIMHNYPYVQFKTVSDVVPLAERSLALWISGQTDNFPLHISN